MTIDGAFLGGVAAIITAMAGAGWFTVRGINKRKAGVPAREDEIDRDLLDDKRELIADVDELHAKLETERQLRLRLLDAAERRRQGEVLLYQQKLAEVIQERNELADNAARNRRRFIEKYGESELSLFIAPPPVSETWTAAELREFRRLAEGQT